MSNKYSMNLLKYAKDIKPCQRNWNEDYVMPMEHIDYITEVCTEVPTKQNLPVYDLYRITNRKIIDDIFEASYVDHDDDTIHRNTQVKSNLLLIWAENLGAAEYNTDTYIGVGISSGAAALAGAELGYKTGFCRCFMPFEIKSILWENNIKIHIDSKIILMLGIGVPDETVDPREYTVGSKKGKIQKSINKTINVIDIV